MKAEDRSYGATVDVLEWLANEHLDGDAVSGVQELIKARYQDLEIENEGLREELRVAQQASDSTTNPVVICNPPQ